MNGQFSSLDEFWPFYLSQHLNRTTRRLHFAGTTLGLLLLALAPLLREPRLLLAALAAAYGCAWIGHFFFERNAPATFKYPLLSLRADFRMYARMWRGGLEGEIARDIAGIRAFRDYEAGPAAPALKKEASSSKLSSRRHGGSAFRNDLP